MKLFGFEIIIKIRRTKKVLYPGDIGRLSDFVVMASAYLPEKTIVIGTGGKTLSQEYISKLITLSMRVPSSTDGKGKA